jgi:hypothetical protein
VPGSFSQEIFLVELWSQLQISLADCRSLWEKKKKAQCAIVQASKRVHGHVLLVRPGPSFDLAASGEAAAFMHEAAAV